MAQLRAELMSAQARTIQELPPDLANYMVYIYTWLSSSAVGIIDESKIDITSEAYLGWKADEISLRDYLYDGIAQSWVDTTKLNADNKYSSADDIYQQLVDYSLGQLMEDVRFTKRIYRFLINDNIVTGRQLCLALYDQGVLESEPDQIAALHSNGDSYAYSFLLDKISKIQITPAQLALDPCSGSCVITNVRTGEVLSWLPIQATIITGCRERWTAPIFPGCKMTCPSRCTIMPHRHRRPPVRRLSRLRRLPGWKRV